MPHNDIADAFMALLDALVADSLARVSKPQEGRDAHNGLLNRKEAAKYLSVSGPTVGKLVKAGEIKAIVIPGTSARRYTRRSLDGLIRRQEKKV